LSKAVAPVTAAAYAVGMFGFLNVYKPAGPTSHDVVAGVRRLIGRPGGRKVKVGHAGTLDPFAAGVLVVALGPATRLERFVHALPKRYAAVVRLGATSTTGDPEGEIVATPGAAAPTADRVGEALAGMVGEISQGSIPTSRSTSAAVAARTSARSPATSARPSASADIAHN